MDPHDTLRILVRANDCEEIIKLVQKHTNLLTYEYDKGKTILEIACSSSSEFSNRVNTTTIIKLLCLSGNLLNNYKTTLPVLGETANLEDLIKSGTVARRLDANNKMVLHWAETKLFTDVIEYLLIKSDNEVSQEDISALRNLSLVPGFEESRREINAVNFLQEGNEDLFLKKIKELDQLETFQDQDDGPRSFLQVACEFHCVHVVRYLSNRDPNKVGTEDKRPPLIIALEKGYYNIAALLFDAKNIIIPDGILIDCLHRAHKTNSSENVDFIDFRATCLLVIQKCNQVDINMKEHKKFPLYYACKLGDKAIIQELLKRKPSLANQDANNLTINHIDYDSLKQHFNECLKINEDENGKPKSLTFDYTSLLPTDCICFDENETQEEEQETKIINPNVMDKALEKLMNRYFETNVLIDPNLLRRKPTICKNHDNECGVILHLSEDPYQKQLLEHPLISNFINVKWNRIRWIFFLNFIFYLLFFLTLIFYIYHNFNVPSTESYGWSFWLLFVSTISLFVREMFHGSLLLGKYFRNFENFFKIFLLIDIYLIFVWTDNTVDIKRQLYVFALLMSSIELFWSVCHITCLSTYIIMFKKVLYTFCIYLVLNLLLILPFAFCFFTLFRNNSPNYDEMSQEFVNENSSENLANYSEEFQRYKGGRLSENQERDISNLFNNYSSAVLKTFVMLTGGYDVGSLNFDKALSAYIFVIFVIIAIVLMNMLNGLAISDIQKIKKEATLMNLIMRVEYISVIEKSLINDIFNSRAKISCVYLNDLKQVEIDVDRNGRGVLKVQHKDFLTTFFICFSMGTKTIKRIQQIFHHRHYAGRY